jgi:hypothetical protein
MSIRARKWQPLYTYPVRGHRPFGGLAIGLTSDFLAAVSVTRLVTPTLVSLVQLEVARIKSLILLVSPDGIEPSTY